MRTSPLRQDVTGFVVLLAFFALGAFALTSSTQDGPQTVSLEGQPDPSVENTRASGSDGLYLWTAKLGYKPAIWHQSFNDLPDDAAVVVSIAPNATPDQDIDLTGANRGDTGGKPPKQNRLTGEEGVSVKSWLSRGHTLILLASSLPTAAQAAVKDADTDDDTDQSTTFASVLGVDMQSAQGGSASRRDFAPMQPGQWTSGVTAIRVHPGTRLKSSSGNGVVLAGDFWKRPARTVPHGTTIPASDEPQPVAAVYTVGKGRLIAVADDYFACNSNLNRADNAVFMYNLLRQSASPGAKILFDEYHREIGGAESSSVWAALGRPLQYAALQLVLVALVCLAVLAPRLGRTVPIPGRDIRTSAEYITSLAGLYQTARATKTALETVYRQFLREVCLRYGLPSSATLDTLAEVASRQGRVNGADLKKVLIACEHALESKHVSGRDMITLVRAIERFRKELGIG